MVIAASCQRNKRCAPCPSSAQWREHGLARCTLRGKQVFYPNKGQHAKHMLGPSWRPLQKVARYEMREVLFGILYQ